MICFAISKLYIAFATPMCYDNYVSFCWKIWRNSLMGVSYKKLWKLLIDRDMKKKELQLAAKLSTSTMSKLNKCQNVQMDVLVRVCRVLECDIGEIVEILPVNNSEEMDTKIN